MVNCVHIDTLSLDLKPIDADGRPSSDVVSIRLHVHPTRLIGKRGRLDETRNTANTSSGMRLKSDGKNGTDLCRAVPLQEPIPVDRPNQCALMLMPPPKSGKT
ncbi:hypothetical protein PGT21_004682 [Puccinia graminis f. sp. tritici]|uniref:Uncharacterized protein n=1 Tax=Puccinia graminis f. sp. tritici TaxID=56615 RepID=A0A5B0QZD5_PUCGR|nr:hypothetical protein PGT21_004682 [Puccinia graminis f. sp. tritici]KAA1118343.1 hypothetical protein PGTUg99_002382 [Puccinia graminis f. sp. tritici]